MNVIDGDASRGVSILTILNETIVNTTVSFAFSSPHVRAVMLRGIAWAERRDVDSLTTPEEVAGLKISGVVE